MFSAQTNIRNGLFSLKLDFLKINFGNKKFSVKETGFYVKSSWEFKRKIERGEGLKMVILEKDDSKRKRGKS